MRGTRSGGYDMQRPEKIMKDDEGLSKMTKDQVLEPLNWTPDAGIVAPVHPNLIPYFNLPDEATPIQIGGKPAYHVTLIKRRALEHCGAAMAEVWPGILADLPAVPVAQPCDKLIKAKDPVSGTLAWIVELHNADAYEALRKELTDRLEQAFEAAGHPGLQLGANPVRWHITVANNRDGDPFQSSSDPHRFLKPQRSIE
jgi:hypothetical protein